MNVPTIVALQYRDFMAMNGSGEELSLAGNRERSPKIGFDTTAA
ncbi:hypothetical protein V1281_000876 [Nitrobacteraceae bacterium AZCC 2161]